MNNNKIDNFVRDVCSVTPKSKSEVRVRLQEIIEIAVRKERGKISKIINEYSPKKATETLEYVLLDYLWTSGLDLRDLSTPTNSEENKEK